MELLNPLISEAGGYVVRDTFTNISANYPASSYNEQQAWATDLLCSVRSNGTLWRPVPQLLEPQGSPDFYMVFGGSGATWSRNSSGLITVTSAAHTLVADYNGAFVHMTAGTLLTGSTNLTTGWNFTNLTYVDANTFTVQSAVLSAATGALGSNTAETYFPTIWTAPVGLMRAGDAINALNFSLGRAKSNANTKTIKDYVGNAPAGTISFTTNTVFSAFSGSSIAFKTSSTFIANGTATIQTATDTTHKRSIALSNAGDWFLQMPYRTQLAFHGS